MDITAEFKPPIDETLDTPSADDALRDAVDRHTEGMYRITLSRKTARRKFKQVAQVSFGSPAQFKDMHVAGDTEDLVEAILLMAVNYCTNIRDPEDDGAVTFRVQLYIANPSGPPKRPSFEWTFDPHTEDQEMYFSDSDDFGGNPHEKIIEKLINWNSTLLNKLDDRDASLMRMMKLNQSHLEPLAQLLQMMGFGWIQGIQMQQNAAQAMAEVSQQKEDAKASAERWKIAGTVLSKALPVLAEKGSSFALLQMAKKMGLEGDALKAFMAGAKPGDGEAPALELASGDASFNESESNDHPLATMAKAFAAFIRPGQWGFITEKLTPDEFQILRDLFEAPDDAGVLAAYERFTTEIDSGKLAAIYGQLDTDQAAELDRLAEIISKMKAAD